MQMQFWNDLKTMQSNRQLYNMSKYSLIDIWIWIGTFIGHHKTKKIRTNKIKNIIHKVHFIDKIHMSLLSISILFSLKFDWKCVTARDDINIIDFSMHKY